VKWNIDDVPVFVAVVEQRSMTAAAEVLDMPKSTVSTTIARLEKALGLRLFDRDSRSLRITAEGASFHRHAQMILEQVREADATVAGLRADPAGLLTVAMPPAFCQEIVAPRLPEFRAAYPKIDLEILITNSGMGLLRDTVDVAVVVGPMVDSDMVTRTLIAGPLICVASPGWLARHEQRPGLEDLRAQIMFCETRYGLPRMAVHVHGQAQQIDLATGISHVDSPLVVRDAVVNGGGISLLPRHYCRAQIAAGTLVEVYEHVAFDVAASTLSAVYLSRRLMSPRLRVFVDFLAEASR